MKQLFAALFAIAISTAALDAAQTAQGRLYCLSLTLHQCSDPYGDKISVDSSGTTEGADEMIPMQPAGSEIFFPASDTYIGNLAMFDALYEDTYYGSLYLYLPIADDNGNRHSDFFEVSKGFAYVSGGGYYSAGVYGGYGNVNATWFRAPGARTGTVSMFFDGWSQYTGNFVGTFEIIEYTGPVTYTPATNSVSASVDLAQTGASANHIRGPIQLDKTATNHFNTLMAQAGIWTNAASQQVSFLTHLFERDTAWPTNYAGYMEFDNDNNPLTFQVYALWVLSINDSNDADHDGIPDFSDDPQAVTPPRRGSLSAEKTSTNLWLTISGDVGHVNVVQQSPTLNPPSWQDVLTVTLTSDPQKVSLPLPGASPRFYRVGAQ